MQSQLIMFVETVEKYGFKAVVVDCLYAQTKCRTLYLDNCMRRVGWGSVRVISKIITKKKQRPLKINDLHFIVSKMRTLI